MRRGLTLMLSWMCCFAGCGAPSGPPEPVVLAKFDFSEAREDPALSVVYDLASRDRHCFGKGWDKVNPPGVWTVADSAVVHLTILGSGATLSLGLSTHPELAAEQRVDISLNGHSLAHCDTFGGQWQEASLEIPIPDDLLTQGANRLVLRPTKTRLKQVPKPGGVAKRAGIFLKRLDLVSMLDGKQRKRWQDLHDDDVPLDAWQLRPIDEDPPRIVGREDTRPDVLVFLLDAARADHFSAYGYGRATTPNIDALAARGVRFERVYSVAPFTLIATASLMSGTSWRDHQVLAKGDALSDSFTTWAEVMGRAGYATLGFTDNPFASSATGIHQGFDEFVESWRQAGYEGPGRSHELIEELFARRCADGIPDAPLFAYFHHMPPHDPYWPGPSHDLWRDPGYRGDVDGSSEQLQSFIDGDLVLRDTDRKRLVSLYDGNLHRIDASVGRMLAGFRSLGRARPLLIVITSDHGEAFGEHGELGHLTTVYDEMLHIPLVLAGDFRLLPSAKHRSDLLAITDIAAIVISRAGVQPPSATVWPRRFAALSRGEWPRRDGILLRSNEGHHISGYRTAKALVFSGGFLKQGLFDLRSDAGARVNLRLDKPRRYLELMGRMRALIRDRQVVGGPGEANLDDADLEILRSLGYL